MVKILFFVTIVGVFLLAGFPAFCDDGWNDDAGMDVETFHQSLVDSCAYGMKEGFIQHSMDPSPYSGMINQACLCVDDWARANNINNLAAVRAAQTAYLQTQATCLHSARIQNNH